MGQQKYALANETDGLNDFVRQLLVMESTRIRPTTDSSLYEIYGYCRQLGMKLKTILKNRHDTFPRIVPLIIRRIFLRHEELTHKPSYSEYYDQIGARNAAADDRTTFWRSMTLDDFRAFAP